MKFIVTSEVTPGDYQQVSDITWPIIQEYCDRHGYEFRPKIVENPERDVIWERVKSLQEALRDCDWAVHIDADCLITNLNIPLTEFVEPNKSIVISCAPYQGKPMFNDGFMMVKSDEYGIRSIRDTWHIQEEGVYCAQDAMWYLHKISPYIGMSIQPQKRFNSFLWSEYGETEYKQGSWTVGDYLLHIPGRTNERRVELLNQYLPEIIR